MVANRKKKLASLGNSLPASPTSIKEPLNFVNNFLRASAGGTDRRMLEVLDAAALDGKDAAGRSTSYANAEQTNIEKIVQSWKNEPLQSRKHAAHFAQGLRRNRPADIQCVWRRASSRLSRRAAAEKPAVPVTLQRDFDARAGTIELFPRKSPAYS